jgi:hypothetical protein
MLLSHFRVNWDVPCISMRGACIGSLTLAQRQHCIDILSLLSRVYLILLMNMTVLRYPRRSLYRAENRVGPCWGACCAGSVSLHLTLKERIVSEHGSGTPSVEDSCVKRRMNHTVKLFCVSSIIELVSHPHSHTSSTDFLSLYLCSICCPSEELSFHSHVLISIKSIYQLRLSSCTLELACSCVTTLLLSY